MSAEKSSSGISYVRFHFEELISAAGGAIYVRPIRLSLFISQPLLGKRFSDKTRRLIRWNDRRVGPLLAELLVSNFPLSGFDTGQNLGTWWTIIDPAGAADGWSMTNMPPVRTGPAADDMVFSIAALTMHLGPFY